MTVANLTNEFATETFDAQDAREEAEDNAILMAAKWNLYDLRSGSCSGAGWYAQRDFNRLSISGQQRIRAAIAALGK